MEQEARVSRWLEDIRDHRRLALDTNVVIYLLEGVAPYVELAQHLLRLMERGLVVGVVSTLVEAEVFTKPLREGNQPALDRAETFFRTSRNLVIRSLDRGVARRAAVVRAGSHLRLPDAIIVATALEEGCDAVVSNDEGMIQQAIGIPCVYLGNYIGRRR